VNQDSKHSLEGYMAAAECIKVLFPAGGCCLRTFRKLHSQGFLPYLQLGRNVLYKPSDVMATLERNLKVKAVQ
jgi:hypothetical protein